jgi:signal transduction histidine kinase
MARRAKPAKAKVEPKLPAGKARESEDSKVRDLEKRLAAAQEQQAATAAILRLIAGSPADVQPVFDTIVQTAVRLCSATIAGVSFLREGLLYHPANYGGSPEALAAIRERYPRPLDMSSSAGIAILTRSVYETPDIEDPSVPESAREAGRILGFRSLISIPMLREGEAIGALSVTRRGPGGFAEGEVALLRTFADQAVIAIENVRLFNETKESLERQTATSEILRVIAGSPTDVQPVFATIMKNALRLCSAQTASVLTFDGHLIHAGAFLNIPADAEEQMRRLFPRAPDRSSAAGRAILTGDVAEIPDVEADPDYVFASAVRAGGLRSNTAVPMLRDGRAIGTINLGRTVIGRFAESEIALLKIFADQAVIAIENVRLFKELEEKNEALTQAHAQVTESLEQQTATSEILRVISSSPTDVQPVFDAIAESAVRLCNAEVSVVTRFDGTALQLAAVHGVSERGVEAVRSDYPMPIDGRSLSARAVRHRDVVHVADVMADPEYGIKDTAVAAGWRGALAVPMWRDRQIAGVIFVGRAAPGLFGNSHVELLKTFADQAVIAIENVRLFKELEAANRELAAASQHKSEFLANMSHELRTPLNAIIGFSEVLSERMFGELNEKQEEYSKDIHASGQHLLALINDILDLSKIEAGRMELELTDFDLPTALDNALMLVRERAQRRSLTLDKDLDAGVGQIQGDERKIRQVVLNLLSNAIKFTPEGGRIELAAVPKDGLVEVSVRDTGVGIAPEDQEAVFEEFRQVGTADKKAEGTGLGLTLCRKFTELHGGKIWVKSQLGAGSTFTFTIPVHRGE